MRTRRCVLVSLAAACAVAAPSFAQTDTTLRLGAIGGGSPMAPDSPFGKILIAALADLGYELGRNLNFDSRGGRFEAKRLRFGD